MIVAGRQQLLSDSAGRQLTVSRRLIVKAGGRVVFLSFDEIDWVDAAANYVRIYVGKHACVLRQGIGEIAERDGKELSCSRGYRPGLQELIDKTL